MRVLFNSWRDLAHPLAGGAEVVLDQLATGLVERGHHVEVRCGGPTDHRAYPVHCGGGDLSQYLLTPLHHRRLGRTADVVVDVSNGMSFFTPLFDRSVPTVAFVHHVHTEQWGMYFPEPIAAIGRRLETDAMPWAYRNGLTVTVSPSSKQSLVGIGVHPDRIRVLPPAATLEPVDTTRSATPVFVALGRLTLHKRVDLLLEMWERVRPVTGGELVIIGDGPERPRLEGLAGDSVRFVGNVDERTKASLLASSWALVHAASHEGWGLVITEAGLAGVPSIGFDVAGVRDAIRCGRTGRLAHDDREFVARWIELGTDHAIRCELGIGARARAAEAELTTRVSVFEEVLAEAVRLHEEAHRPGQRRRLGGGGDVDMARRPASTVRSGRIVMSIVVPAFNEAERIPRLLSELDRHVDPETSEVIVVDDGSGDDTTAVAQRSLARFPHGRVETLPTNVGKGGALRHGVARARGELVLFMDADMATDLACIDALLEGLRDADIAIGSRAVAGSHVAEADLHRRLMGGAFNKLTRTLTSIDVADSQCGFKAFRGDVARLLFHMSTENGFALDVEILELAARLGLRTVEVPVRWNAVAGSKVRPVRDSARMALAVARITRRAGRACVVPTLTVAVDADEVESTYKSMRDLVRVTDPVLVGDDHVTVVLAGLDRDTAGIVADRLTIELGTAVDASSVGGASLILR